MFLQHCRGQNMTRSRADHNFVPETYEELYEHYIGSDIRSPTLCRKLIRNFLPHATPDELEQLPHDVFARIIEKDLINKYDPTKANFGGVIFFVTRTIVVNHLSRKGRNPVTGLCRGSLTETMPEDGVFEPGVYYLDKILGTDEGDPDAALDAKALVSQLLSWTKSLQESPRHTRDRGLHTLLQAMLSGEDPELTAARLGVTVSTLYNWVDQFRQKLTEWGYGEAKKQGKKEDPWVNLMGKTPRPEDFEYRLLSLRDQLKTLHEQPRHKRDASLYPLLEMVADVQFSMEDAATKLRVSPSTISGWLSHMRKMLLDLQPAKT